MSEEEAVESAEQAQEKPEHYDPDKAEKHGWIDFEKIPEDVRGDVEKRFNELYTGLKKGEARSKSQQAMIDQMAKDNRAVLEKLEEFQSSIADGQSEAEANSLQAQLEAAHEEGDTKKVAEITRQLTALEVKRSQPKPEKKEERDPVADRFQNEVNAWATEQDENGQLKRPWTQQGHELQETVAAIAAGVQQLPKNRGLPPSEWLDQVDEQVRSILGEKPKRVAPVLESNQNISERKSEPTKLSNQEMRVAEKMFPEMEPKKAHERYSKARKKVA